MFRIEYMGYYVQLAKISAFFILNFSCFFYLSKHVKIHLPITSMYELSKCICDIIPHLRCSHQWLSFFLSPTEFLLSRKIFLSRITFSFAFHLYHQGQQRLRSFFSSYVLFTFLVYHCERSHASTQVWITPPTYHDRRIAQGCGASL